MMPVISKDAADDVKMKEWRAYVSTVPTRVDPDAAPRWQGAEGEVA